MKKKWGDLMIITYAREDIPAFSLEEQNKYLSRYDYDYLYIDKGVSNERICCLFELLNEGDTLIICELSCLELTMLQLPDFFEKLRRKQVKFMSILDEISIDPLENSLFLDFLNLVAKTESKVKSNLTIKGLHQAKEKGRIGGRPALSPQIIDKINDLWCCGKYSYRQIAELCNVSLGVVHKYLKGNDQQPLDTMKHENV